MKKIMLLLSAVLVSMGLQAANPVKITVSNSLNTARTSEMVEIPLATLQKNLGKTNQFIVTDADGKEIPSQLTYDQKLIFQPAVGVKGKSFYYVKPGIHSFYEPRVFGRQFPERVDDMAWENDLVAFRCYGPALQKSGERAWGYDIWNKRTSKLVVEERYAQELDKEISSVRGKLQKLGQNDLADDVYNAVSYHVDHGTGMDCYKVGPTLGAGTTAILANNGADIVFPKCYTDYEILDKGPLRFTVKLVYGNETLDGQQYNETRIITLDAGSQLNKAVVTYNGLSKPTPIATGIIVHNENPTAYVLNTAAGYMGYEDLGDPNQYKEKYRAKQNKDFGKIYVGAVYTQKPTKMEYRAGEGLPGACGHILGISNYKPSSTYTYYFGSGWSRNPATNFQSLTDWEAYLSRFAQQVKSPLKVSVK